jgi:adenylate cyclase
MFMPERLASVCLVCGTTLQGPVGVLFHLFGIRRSGRNPNVCNRCDAHMQEGRIIEMSVLFADLASFTEMTHRLGAERSYQVVDSFFKMANGVLVKHDAFIDKYIGDAVMAIFNAPIRNTEHAAAAAAAAVDILEGIKTLRQELKIDLRARVGVASGYARVGRVGSEERKDYTAIGDVVNLASRLEAQAFPGEVLVDGTVYARIAEDYPQVPAESLTIRGFDEPIAAYRIVEEKQAQRPAHAADEKDPARSRQAVGLGAVLFAILGAPCAATTILGPLSVALGLGAAFGSLGPVMHTLDSAPVRIPLQIFAVLGAVVNLYVIWYANRQRRKLAQDANVVLPELTRWERNKVRLVAGLSLFSLLTVAYEMYAHVFLEKMSLF